MDVAASALVAHLDHDIAASVDKRHQLSIREFGYKSVHIVAKLDGSRYRAPENALLRDKCFEVQVRSVLEHAWAEIEHEVVYKGGVTYPDSTLRRFAAIAGTLEILGREFESLAEEAKTLALMYRDLILAGKGLAEALDVARLSGALRAWRPSGRTLEEMSSGGFGSSHGAARLVAGLAAVGVDTATKLDRRLRTVAARRVFASYAAAAGCSAEALSHAAVAGLLIGVTSQRALLEAIPEYARDPNVATALAAARRGAARRRAKPARLTGRDRS